MIRCPICGKAAQVKETRTLKTQFNNNIVDICVCGCGCEFKREFDIQYTILNKNEGE